MMNIQQDYSALQKDCEQLTSLGQNGKHAFHQIVPQMSQLRSIWYNTKKLPSRTPAPDYNKEPSYDIALQYEKAESFFPREGIIYDSYQCFIQEIVEQYELIMKFIQCIPSIEQYDSSDSMRDDLHNGVLRYLPTEETWDKEDILLGYYMYDSVETANGLMIANDVFRIVHDVFAHSAGFSFNSYGEYFAWWVHRDSLQPLGRYALFCETRAQNNWTNFLPQHAQLHPAERPFPRPKAVMYNKNLV